MIHVHVYTKEHVHVGESTVKKDQPWEIAMWPL